MEKVDVSKLIALPFGRGRAGKCYVLHNGYLLKQYDILDEFTLRYEEEKIKKFVGRVNRTYIYPEDAYFLNGYLNQSKIKYIPEDTMLVVNKAFLILESNILKPTFMNILKEYKNDYKIN